VTEQTGTQELDGWLQRFQRRVRQWQGTEPQTHIQLQCDTEVRGGWHVLPQLIKPGDIVYSFDMGADLVLERALLEERDARVYLFDPDPGTVNRAAGVPGRLHLSPIRVGAEDRPALPGDDPRDAEVRRIASLMKDRGHQRLSLVKLVEGPAATAVHEIVSLGMDVRQLLVAIPERQLDRRARVEAMVESLDRRGYRILHIDPAGQRYTFLRTDFTRR
jgi:hypothetical protein